MNENANISVIGKNLADANRRISDDFEVRDAHIYELAYETLSRIRSAGFPDTFCAMIESDEVRALILDCFSQRETSDGVVGDPDADAYVFTQALAEGREAEISDVARILFGEGKGSPDTESKIALIRNAGSDRAFEIFAAVLHGVEAFYAETFSSACEAVSENSAGYAVIPLGSLLDGRLDGLYRIMEKYDLSILASCSVPSDDGNVTRYALAGKGTAPRGERLRFEFKAALDPARDIAKILGAAEHFGAGAERVEALPSLYGRENTYGFTLEVSERSAALMALYLSLFFSQYIPLGIYADVSEE